MDYFTTNYTGSKPEYGMFRGIVISTDDPACRDSGRVQVFIPEIMGYDLGGVSGGKNTFTYKFPGNNILSDLTSDVIDYLKDICPWALPAYPIMGDEGPGVYDGSTGQASVTENTEYGNIGSQSFEQGTFPSVQYEYNPPSDPFVDPYEASTAESNVYGYDYGAPSFSNHINGSFGVPRVGAHVLIAFFKGDINFPIYLGHMPSVTDIRSLFNGSGTSSLYKDNYDSVKRQSPEQTSAIAKDQITINKTLRS